MLFEIRIRYHLHRLCTCYRKWVCDFQTRKHSIRINEQFNLLDIISEQIPTRMLERFGQCFWLKERKTKILSENIIKFSSQPCCLCQCKLQRKYENFKSEKIPTQILLVNWSKKNITRTTTVIVLSLLLSLFILLLLFRCARLFFVSHHTWPDYDPRLPLSGIFGSSGAIFPSISKSYHFLFI